MRLPNFLTHLILLSFTPHLHTLAQGDLQPDLQFITYLGTITGNFLPGHASLSPCVPYSLGTILNASISVGVNPPYDTNPFYIAFRSDGHEATPSLTCFDCTDDSVWALHFVSAAYPCIVIETGKQCNGYYYGNETEQRSFELVDLNKATVNPIQMNGESGYSVFGDQETVVVPENGIITNQFAFQEVDAYATGGEEGKCFQEFYWNEKTPFTYTVNFTNSTSTALWTVNAPNGMLNISFSGKRADDLNDESKLLDPTSHGRDNLTCHAIALNTSNPKVPGFMFANGSRLEFENQTAQWVAVLADQNSTASKSIGAQVGGVHWSLLLSVMGLGGFVFLW